MFSDVTLAPYLEHKSIPASIWRFKILLSPCGWWRSSLPLTVQTLPMLRKDTVKPTWGCRAPSLPAGIWRRDAFMETFAFVPLLIPRAFLDWVSLSWHTKETKCHSGNATGARWVRAATHCLRFTGFLLFHCWCGFRLNLSHWSACVLVQNRSCPCCYGDG